MNYRIQNINCCMNCEFHDYIEMGVRVMVCKRLDSERANQMVYRLGICDLYKAEADFE